MKALRHWFRRVLERFAGINEWEDELTRQLDRTRAKKEECVRFGHLEQASRFSDQEKKILIEMAYRVSLRENGPFPTNREELDLVADEIALSIEQEDELSEQVTTDYHQWQRENDPLLNHLERMPDEPVAALSGETLRRALHTTEEDEEIFKAMRDQDEQLGI